MYLDILRWPDFVTVQSEDGWLKLENTGGVWANKGIEVETGISDLQSDIVLRSPAVPVKRIMLRWLQDIPTDMRILNDHWERGYGDLEWRGMVPERILPWYLMTWDKRCTHGYGVKTGAKAICFWQVDTSGISLYLDVRCGGSGVQLGSRELIAAQIVVRKGYEGETPFAAAKSFCRTMCSRAILPSQPVYGGNNWYYAYGNSSHSEILEDSKLISSLAPNGSNRPFMVIDDGWQLCHSKSCNGGPWNAGNYKFPDMQKLAGEMEETGVRPGIWYRPLLTEEMIPGNWTLPNSRFISVEHGQFMDPSIPEVLEKVAEDVKGLAAWGYEMIKHDFTTYDILGRWGFEMGTGLTKDGWSFKDRSKTTAEIISNLYSTIRASAGGALIIGCNTIGHLGAGLFEIQRTGDDTSGREWERTRKMGINTLAFRMPQNGIFFVADADCVGLTGKVPWELNEQWLKLLSLSGTPLFVSVSPDAVGKDQEKALVAAFEAASKPLLEGEPLDWLETTCPSKWVLDGREMSFEWFGKEGVAVVP